VEHLDQTNKWLAEMDEFKDLTGDLPATELRLGFETPEAAQAPGPAALARGRPAPKLPNRTV
jgi:hypothetical protein